MEKECKYCKTTFTAQRSSAKYCSTSCRVQYNQLQKRMADYAHRAMDALDSLLEIYLDYPEFIIEVEAAMAQINTHASNMRYNEIDSYKLTLAERERLEQGE